MLIKKMVWIVTSDLYDGGTSVVSYNYYKMFKDNGFKARIITLNDLPISSKYSIPCDDIINLNLLNSGKERKSKVWSVKGGIRLIFSFYKAARLISRLEGNIIFVHFIPILIAQLLHFFKLRSSNCIYALHTNIFSYRNGLLGLKGVVFDLFIKALTLGDKIVFLTSDVSNKFKDRINDPKFKSKIYTIPNVFKSITLDESTLNDFSSGIIYSGRLSDEKNVKFIVDVYYRYKELGGVYDLTIAGDGPCRKELEKMVRCGLYSENITFLGQVAEMSAIYSKGKILILASKNEGFGMVLLEAINFHLLILSSNCESGPASIFEPKTSIPLNTFYQNDLGILLPTPVDNVDDYALALLKLEKEQTLSVEVVKDALSHFQQGKIFPKWSKLLT